MRRVLVHFYTLLSYAALGTSTLVNRTIDDELGDSVTGLLPTYLPDGSWTQGSNCSYCRVTPAIEEHPDEAFNFTWHDTSYVVGQTQERTMQARFNGTAVYVFNIIANDFSSIPTLTNLSFFLDGTYVDQYVHDPVPREQRILYRVPVYVNEHLTNTEHTIIMRANGPNSSLVLFDSITYTTDSLVRGRLGGSMSMQSTPAASSSSGQSKLAILVGSIVGAIVGVVTALLTLTVVLCILRRRKQLALPLFYRRKHRKSPESKERPSSATTVEDLTSRSSLISLPATPRAPSPIVSSLNNSDGTQPSWHSDLVFAPIPTPSTVANVGRASASPYAAATPPRTPQYPFLVTPPTHCIDVPTGALSMTGTEHSVRLTELTREIRELEAGMRDIQGVKKSNSLRTSSSLPFDVLRERVVRLRGELEKERQLMAAASPDTKKKWRRKERQRELRVVS